jgi:hypothetical protein
MRPFGKSPAEKVQEKVVPGDVRALAAGGLSALVVLGGVTAASAVVSAIRSRGGRT